MTTKNQNEQRIRATPHICGRKTTIRPAITPYRISLGSPHSFGILNMRSEEITIKASQEKSKGERSDNSLSSISTCDAIWKPTYDENSPTRGGSAKRPRGGFSHFIALWSSSHPMTVAAGIVSNAAFLWKAR